MKRNWSCTFALFIAAATLSGVLYAAEEPLKIYILAGQSNMEGQGLVGPETTPGTLEYIVTNDPAKHYRFLVDKDGEWVERDDVYIVYSDKCPAPSQKAGKLIAGFGWPASRPDDKNKIGPELGFGHVVGGYLESDILLIKFAKGDRATKVADNYKDLWSGGLDAAIDVDEQGNRVVSRGFTGTNPQGNKSSGGGTYKFWVVKTARARLPSEVVTRSPRTGLLSIVPVPNRLCPSTVCQTR